MSFALTQNNVDTFNDYSHLDVCNDIGNGNKQKKKILGKASEYSLIVYFVIFYVHLIIY